MQDLLTKGIDEQAATSAVKPPMLSRIVLWEWIPGVGGGRVERIHFLHILWIY
ncbi:MAG: hypothetical protein R2784_14840 [Saprospiraceae bacterium]